MICDHQETSDSVAYIDDGLHKDADAKLEDILIPDDILMSTFNMTESTAQSSLLPIIIDELLQEETGDDFVSEVALRTTQWVTALFTFGDNRLIF